MTIILGGDSLFHKTKTPKSIPCYQEGSPRRQALARVRQDGDSTGDRWTRLDSLFVYAMYCWFLFLFAMNDLLCLKALTCIFISCHAWYIRYGYRFYCILSCITFIIIIIIFLRAHILNFKLGGGVAACLMT